MTILSAFAEDHGFARGWMQRNICFGGMFASKGKASESHLLADNPDEYAEIVAENFGISYESGYIKVPRALPVGLHS